jgi:hypothetical protein
MSQNKYGSLQPEKFDGAYLLTSYASEYDMNEIPKFYKSNYFHYLPGSRLLEKYKHFKDAPEPIKV